MCLYQKKRNKHKKPVKLITLTIKPFRPLFHAPVESIVQRCNSSCPSFFLIILSILPAQPSHWTLNIFFQKYIALASSSFSPAKEMDESLATVYGSSHHTSGNFLGVYREKIWRIFSTVYNSIIFSWKYIATAATNFYLAMEIDELLANVYRG